MRQRARRIALFVSVALFAVLLIRSCVLIVAYGEYEPKFGGPGVSLGLATIANAVLAGCAFALSYIVSLGAIWKPVLFRVAVLLVAVACGIAGSSEAWKRESARRAVRYVYWRNFHAVATSASADGRHPLPSISALEQPRCQILLHGVWTLERDPWGHPYQYVLLPDVFLDHPHRKNWDIEWAFWSTGKDGRDDGDSGHDDIDVTNAGL